MEELTPFFEKKRLSKKSLLDFLEKYESALFKPIEGTEEERRAGYADEWQSVNEDLKKQGLKKKVRRRKREQLKMKWGIRTGYKGLKTQARMTLIASLKKTFNL